MPVSSVSQVDFSQEWLAGDTTIFLGNEETDFAPDVFSTEIELPAVPPLAERVRITVNAVGVPAVDGDVTYGGNFKPDLNGLTITGNLDAEQTATVISAISVTPGGQGEADVFEFFATAPAAAGAQMFTLTIPYVEQNVDYPQDFATFPFIDFWQDTGAPVTDNTLLIVNNDTDKFIQIEAGIVSETIDSVNLSNNVPSNRGIEDLTATSTATTFDITFEEDIFREFIFQVYALPVIPSIQFGSWTANLFWEFEVFSTPTSVTIQNIEGRCAARTNTGSAYISGYPGSYLRLFRGMLLTLDVPNSRRDITLTLTWNNANISSRTYGFAAWFRNNYSAPVDIRVTPTGEFNSRLEISGRDNTGSFNQVNIEIGDLKIGEIEAAIEAAVVSIPGWSGSFKIEYNTNTAIRGQLLEEARADWILEIPSSQVSAGGFEYFVYASFPFDVTPPQYIVNVPDGLTLREIFDVTSLFNNAFPNSNFPIAVEPNTVWGSGGDTWLDSTETFRALTSQVSTYSSTSNAFNQRFSIEIFDENRPWASFVGLAFPFANYANIGQLSAAINAAFANDGISITADAGLYYDSVPTTFLPPSSTETVLNIGVFDNDRYRVEAGTDGRITDNVIVNNSYSKSAFTIQELCNQVVSDYPGVLDAIPLNNLGNESSTTVNEVSTVDLNSQGASQSYDSTFEEPDIKTYNLNSFLQLDSLIGAMNADWNSKDIFFRRNAAVDGRIDATPDKIKQYGGDPNDPLTFVINNTSPSSPAAMVGDLPTTAPPPPVIENVSFDFDIRFAVGGNPNSPTGIQVALGGFQIDGVDFFNQAPNTFFEPVFNTIFDIQFNTFEADKIYLLVWTREDIDGTTFTADTVDFTGLARFSNGAPSQLLSPFKSSSPVYTDPWGETDLSGEMPVLMSVDGISTRIDVAIDQTRILDSINVTLINRPESLNEFAFLARNRTNENQSMAESETGRVFGLALDNRGAWDVLIGPEAVLREVADGEFDYLSRSYDRDFLDTDEGYDFEFFNFDALPAEVQSAISISPVPGYPQVWVLRIDPGVKRYLGTLRQGALPNSLDGCSIDIDLFVRGRISDIEGICRVTVYHDYRCVFDIGLCDFFWNLTDPPEPDPPELIEDNLVFTYQNLIDCQRLDVDSDGSVNEFGLPILITIDNVPTFENGNAILLIKTVYTAEVQGFYWPLENDLNFIQDGTCTFLNSNMSLVERLNKPVLYLPGDPTPITDSFQILEAINNEESYLYVQPRFEFPIQDLNKECGPEEFVLTGIGYQFKNWQNGFRTDDVLIGATLVLGGDVFAAPEIQFCYRYYYNQDEG